MSQLYFNTRCFQCNRRLRVDIDRLGTAMRCPDCRSYFRATQEDRLESMTLDNQRPIEVSKPDMEIGAHADV